MRSYCTNHEANCYGCQQLLAVGRPAAGQAASPLGASRSEGQDSKQQLLQQQRTHTGSERPSCDDRKPGEMDAMRRSLTTLACVHRRRTHSSSFLFVSNTPHQRCVVSSYSYAFLGPLPPFSPSSSPILIPQPQCRALPLSSLSFSPSSPSPSSPPLPPQQQVSTPTPMRPSRSSSFTCWSSDGSVCCLDAAVCGGAGYSLNTLTYADYLFNDTVNKYLYYFHP
jgi:hypothetical protein